MTINYNNKKNKLKRKERKGSRALYTRGWPEARLSNASEPKRDHARAVTFGIIKYIKKKIFKPPDLNIFWFSYIYLPAFPYPDIIPKFKVFDIIINALLLSLGLLIEQN
jgi:hypothetical protein